MTAPEPDAGRAQNDILSVVVTIVDGGATLERCVEALHQQTGTVPLSVLVPFDNTVGDVAALAHLACPQHNPGENLAINRQRQRPP